MDRTIKFGTDGWRAIIAKEFTVEHVARLSFGLADWVKAFDAPDRVVIGYDCRFGGLLFAKTVATVLCEQGIEVCFADRIVSTPMLAMAARDLKCAAGVMLTASHNPAEYNGYKLKSNKGGPMGGEALKLIESYVPDHLPEAWAVKEPMQLQGLSMVDIEAPYMQAIESSFDLEQMRQDSHRFAYDAMYGAGQFVMRKLFPDIAHLRSVHDPLFNGINPEPIARNLGATAEMMKERPELDFCLVNDGDADRIGLLDAEGKFIDSHHIILLLIHYLVKYKGQNGKVVTAFSTVNRVHRLCEHYGLPLEIVKIGFKYASAVMIEEPVMLAGEESGGIAVSTHIPERDGIWMGLMIMEFMALTGKGIRELIEEVYALVGSFVFVRNDLKLDQAKKEAVVERCRTAGFQTFGDYQVQSVENLDGWKYILTEDSWVMIRPSGTEPVLRVYVQAPNHEEAQRIIAAAVAEIKS